MTMKQFDERFGWTAPAQPAKKIIGEVPLVLEDLVKVEDGDDNNQVADPVKDLVGKSRQPKGEVTAVEPFDIRKAILADADFRDAEPVITTLRKDLSLPDWSWSNPVSTDAPLSKRAASGSARERFRKELETFFAGHPEEYEAAAAIASAALSEELSTIEAEA